MAFCGVGKAPEGLRRGDVPEEDGAVAACRCEAGVVGGDGQREDFVGVGLVGLDEAGFWEGLLGWLWLGDVC